MDKPLDCFLSENKELVYKKRSFLLTLLSIIILAFHLVHSFNLRSIGYDRVPEPHIIMDERTYIWQGLSIRKSGIPIGWIAELESYSNRIGGDLVGFNITVDGVLPNLSNFHSFPKPALAVVEIDYGKGIRHTQIVQPFLEKPPLGGLVLSSLISDKVQNIEQLSPAEFRKMSLYLAVATEILLFLLVWQIFKNPLLGLLSALLYGSIPTFVLLSRYALLENLITPLLLLMLNLLIWVYNNPNHYLLKYIIFAAGIVAGLAGLTKQAGWPIILLGVFLLWFWKLEIKKIFLFSLPAFLIGMLYFAWGLYLAPSLFINLYLAEGVQKGFVGSLNLLTSMIKVNILNFPFDGWWLASFISLLFFPREKKLVPLFASIVAVFVGALILSGFNNSWYFIPLIPFMCIATAYLIWKVITQPSFFEIMVFFFTILSVSFFWGFIVLRNPPDIPHYQYQPFNLYRLLFLSFLASGLAWSFLPQLKKFIPLWTILMIGVIYQLIVWNDQALVYIISHWGKLPPLFVLGLE